MNADPPVDTGAGDGTDVGEIIRFDVVEQGADVRVLHVVGELDTLTAPYRTVGKPTRSKSWANQMEVPSK